MHGLGLAGSVAGKYDSQQKQKERARKRKTDHGAGGHTQTTPH